MKVSEISYQETNKFSNLVLDYLKKDEKLKPFINHFPTLENFEKQITEKKSHSIDRVVLIDVLNKQNTSLSLSEKSKLYFRINLTLFSKMSFIAGRFVKTKRIFDA